MKAELKRALDLVGHQRREALARKRLSGDPRNPFRPRYGAELTFAASAQEAETLGYILKLLEKEAARECARRVIPTLDAILDFVIGLGLLALAMLGVAAACVAAGAPDGIWVQWVAPNGKVKAVRPKLVAWRRSSSTRNSPESCTTSSQGRGRRCSTMAKIDLKGYLERLEEPEDREAVASREYQKELFEQYVQKGDNFPEFRAQLLEEYRAGADLTGPQGLRRKLGAFDMGLCQTLAPLP